MENFKYVFQMYGMNVVEVSKQKGGMLVETNEISFFMDIVEKLKLIKGDDKHVYKLDGITADTLNDKKEIHLNFWYNDLNKMEVKRIEIKNIIE